MSDSHSDIPPQFRGDQILEVREMPDGSPLVGSSIHGMNVYVGDPPNQIHSSELKFITRIEGISAEAAERISEIVWDYNQDTGIPMAKITKELLLQALIGGSQN